MTQGKSLHRGWLHIYLDLFARFIPDTYFAGRVGPAFIFCAIAMASFENDREMLHLISAFKEIKSPEMRQAIVSLSKS
ncbi:hypothetical protein IVB41_10470 [Bradyrhizobium sp. 44]|jgi:hypothetical protein|uniref:hypothetical protein n=1 Tax=Bradyrhizobium sp. 44 TaxID=2782675 RepID=UPI001FF94A29|nr:hypothetical protein [Bradyrhizobium sp. 44]MCK1284342.1 hypothetical protein [Bradyrhizobium sp. 44]